tara:strand:+ start:728 stop:1105 length:378 start_codon:yes stop_codon:yes gene_type:complete
MKKYLKDYLGFIIAGLLLIYMVFIKTSGAGIDTSVFKSQIDSLQLRVDSVQLLNDSLKIQATNLNEEIASYDIKIKKLNTQIIVIQDETKIKLDAIDYFGDDELEQFFAKRYGYYKNDSINSPNR